MSCAPLAQRRQNVLALQRTVGNTAAQRMIALERRPASSPIRRACACGGAPGPEGECEACRTQRLAAQRSADETPPVQRDGQHRPSSLASTPAAAASPLPPSVLAEHLQAVGRNDMEAALRAVTRAMKQRGEIDVSKMAPVTAAQGAAVCTTTERYAVDTGMRGAAMTPCGCVGQQGARLPNARIQVGPHTIRDATRLHMGLLHEFRHVLQQGETCNVQGVRGSGGGVCTDCNSPDEMDAYLSEIEAGYERMALLRPWVRVYVNWPYLAPVQQQVFQARREVAQRKVDRHFPNVPWENNARVATYRNHCEQLTQSVRNATNDPTIETRGTCDDPLAPINQRAPTG